MSADTANNEFDVIIIGSGIGALTMASVLAQYQKRRILILEQHFTFGGFTHVFKRKRKFLWDVGIHYIGDLEEGSILRRMFDIIGKEQIKWHKMPELFEKFVYPDFTFEVFANKEKYQADLVAKFPDEQTAIERYFDDIKAINTWFGRHITMKGKAAFADKVKQGVDISGFDRPNITVKEYLDANFKDEKLKAVLCSQWGDYGLPPSQASMLIHAAVVTHYLGGGYYPVGGSGNIAKAIQPIIEEAGGEVKLTRTVEEIIIEGGKAVGVRAKHTRATEGDGIEEYRAPLIVSNAGAFTTYEKLLPKGTDIPFRKQLESFYDDHPVVSNVTLYLGLKDDPRKMGFQGENHWIYSSYDHDANFNKGADWLQGGDIPGAYLSFPSLKDPEAEGFTAEVIAFAEYEPFQKWREQPWKKRDEEYKKMKEEISDKLLAYIDSHYPGFSDMVEYKELSTPITTEHFTGHPRGSIYGVTCVTDRFTEANAPWCQAKSPIEGLYLTGADVSSPGVAGAMMGGLATLAQIPDGLSIMKVVRGAA